MNVRGIAAIAAVGLVSLPALAGATSNLAVTKARMSNHPAFIRLAVDFNGKVPAREVEFKGFNEAIVHVDVRHPNVRGALFSQDRYGVHVGLAGETRVFRISFVVTPRRFKYLSYAVVAGNRLAIDLWKSRTHKQTRTCRGLSLKSWHVKPGLIAVAGTEHGIFENQFQVIVRGADGHVLRRTHVFGPGSWSAVLRYNAADRQAGTLEAVAFSPKDGSLACLAQARVTLPAT